MNMASSEEGLSILRKWKMSQTRLWLNLSSFPREKWADATIVDVSDDLLVLRFGKEVTDFDVADAGVESMPPDTFPPDDLVLRAVRVGWPNGFWLLLTEEIPCLPPPSAYERPV